MVRFIFFHTMEQRPWSVWGTLNILIILKPIVPESFPTFRPTRSFKKCLASGDQSVSVLYSI